MILNWTEHTISWYLDHINYWTIFGLMAVESSFIPFPSEIVIPPAAYKAAQGDMNIFLVILYGSAGALAGALFNYYLALYLGRKLVYTFCNTRLARLMLLKPEAVEKAEKYFNRYGKVSTLIGRLVPAIRQLISIPAGLAKMRLSDFVVFTLIGSSLWNIILALLGYFLYSRKEILESNYRLISYLLLAIGSLVLMYLIVRYKKDKKSQH